MTRPKPARKVVRVSVTFRPEEVAILDKLMRRITSKGGRRFSRNQILQALLGAAARSRLKPEDAHE